MQLLAVLFDRTWISNVHVWLSVHSLAAASASSIEYGKTSRVSTSMSASVDVGRHIIEYANKMVASLTRNMKHEVVKLSFQSTVEII